jgi:outer membrane receptor protein involved in Fe transport
MRTTALLSQSDYRETGLVQAMAYCPLIAVITLVASPAAAQDAADPEAIVVTGRGLEDTPATPAYSIVELDRDALLRTASGRIEDALSGVAGFQQFRRSDSRSSNPSAQGVTLRALGGNATSRALLLLDGVPMADPFFGYIPLSALAPEQLASARVTRGGGSGPFGAGALAGTIELTSAGANVLAPFNGSILLGSNGDSELSGTIASDLGSGFAVASARWDRGQGFWTTPPEQRVPASVRAAYESWSAAVRGTAPLSSTVELQARVLAWRDKRTLRFAGADSLSEGQDASVRVVGRGAWQWEALAYVQARDFANVVISATRFVPTLNQRATPSTGAGGKLEVRPPLQGGHVLRVGADYRLSSGKMFEEAISTATGAITERRSAGGINTDLGLFVEHDWSRGPFTLTSGLRADRFVIRDGFFTATSPDGRVNADASFPRRAGWAASFRGGALVKLGSGWSLRAAAYTGLRLPTLNELYRPFVVFPVATRANPALGNERLVGVEAGVDYVSMSGTRLALTAFDNRVRHAIANVTIGTDLRERRNIDEIRARGLEISANALIGAIRVDGSVALTDAQARDAAALALNGKRPAQTPAVSASATLAWQPIDGSDLALTLRHIGAQFEDDVELDRLPPATTLNAFASLPLDRRLALVFRAENITDTRVVTRNAAGSIDLGAPRTLWAGIRIGR